MSATPSPAPPAEAKGAQTDGVEAENPGSGQTVQNAEEDELEICSIEVNGMKQIPLSALNNEKLSQLSSLASRGTFFCVPNIITDLQQYVGSVF